MNVLITGGAGYIGSLLVPELLNRGHRVRVLDNLSFGQTSLLPYFINDRFQFVKGDIRDERTVKQVVEGADVIVHLASLVGAPICKKNPKLTEDINYYGTRNINNARSESQKMFYASTGSVYGKIDGICTENHPTNPLSEYGITKLRGEQAVMNKGNAISYRFATAFGLSSRLRLDLLPNDFVYNAIFNKYLVIYDKDFRRTFVHVSDIVKSYLFGIENFENMKNEVYNVGHESMNKTKEDIAREVQKHIPFEIYFADKGIPDPDQRDYEVSYEKIRGKGYTIDITFERGVKEMIDGMKHLHIQKPFSNV